jgi:hypothetical protein
MATEDDVQYCTATPNVNLRTGVEPSTYDFGHGVVETATRPEESPIPDPKSAIFTFKSSFSNTFYGFKSRCMILSL